MVFLIYRLAFFCVYFVIFVTAQLVKSNLECDHWAQDENKCLEDPHFMWSHCQTSCMLYARDDDARCASWCAEGECTANPGYIQLHCPECCGMALGWNPWARQSIRMEPVLHDIDWVGVETCPVPQDVLAVADMMKKRLVVFMQGGSSAVVGLSHDSPSPFLGMYGLCEALLYSLRLHDVLFEHQRHQPTIQEGGNRRGHINQYTPFIAEVESVIVSSRYNGDVLMRSLPTWVQRLTQLSTIDFFSIPTTDGEDDSNTCRVPLSGGANDLLIQDLHAALNNDTIPKITIATSPTLSSSSSIQQQPVIVLRNGVSMPSVGLGTWKLNGEECGETVQQAIETIGYRHIDTAQAYRNERDVGAVLSSVLSKGQIKRQDLFIATKLSDVDSCKKVDVDGSGRLSYYQGVRDLVMSQLKSLQVEYIDLYMLHSPIQDKEIQSEIWRCIEDLYDEGIFKSIGVSNFNEYELRHLINTSPAIRILPMVVQNKLDIYHVGKQLDNQGDGIVAYTATMNIVLVAYSSFSSYPFVMKPVDDPIVRHIATRLNISPSQVILKWILQQGYAVIPRSSHVENLKLNLQAATAPLLSSHSSENISSSTSSHLLSNDDMKLLSILSYLVSSPVSKYVTVAVV